MSSRQRNGASYLTIKQYSGLAFESNLIVVARIEDATTSATTTQISFAVALLRFHFWRGRRTETRKSCINTSFAVVIFDDTHLNNINIKAIFIYQQHVFSLLLLLWTLDKNREIEKRKKEKKMGNSSQKEEAEVVVPDEKKDDGGEKPSSMKNNNNKNINSSSNESFVFDDDSSRLSPAIRSSRLLSQPTQSGAQSLSLKFMRSLSCIGHCPECGTDPFLLHESNTSNKKKNDGQDDAPSELYNFLHLQRSVSSISPFVSTPMMSSETSTEDTESIIGQYMVLCSFYKVPYNAGVLTTLRFKLPSLRVSGSFHDTDMLALTELLLKHSNGSLQYIRRLDFTIASKEGKQFKSVKLGFTSHGALALAKTLQQTKFISQVWLPRHRIGPYGASALFWACSMNSTIQDLRIRRCRIGERGAFAFCELILDTSSNRTNGLQNVDLSANGIGHRGTRAIEKALEKRNAGDDFIVVNMEGNLVFQEVSRSMYRFLWCISGEQ